MERSRRNHGGGGGAHLAFFEPVEVCCALKPAFHRLNFRILGSDFAKLIKIALILEISNKAQSLPVKIYS
jgi:hypothetical protein